MKLLASVLLCFLAAWPTVFAEIEKIAVPGEKGISFYWWPKLRAVEGWHQDREHSFQYGVNAFAPNGFTFATAETVMYARAIYKPRELEAKSLEMLPSPELQKMARNRAVSLPIKVAFLLQSAEGPLPLDDRSIDTVVTTWSLCSIPQAVKALGQVKRLLRPGGRLIFMEHGLAPDPGVAVWQNRIAPICRRIGGGCHPNKKIDELVASAGFEIQDLKTFYLPGPRPITYTYQGWARHAVQSEVNSEELSKRAPVLGGKITPGR